MSAKAKFKVGQVLIHKIDGQPVKLVRYDPYGKFPAWYCMNVGYALQKDLRPLTQREKGSK